jgi:DNA replication regulator DPB11
MNLVTNWWVERCLYGKRLVDPTDDILSRPFDHPSISGEFKPGQVLTVY